MIVVALKYLEGPYHSLVGGIILHKQLAVLCTEVVLIQRVLYQIVH